MAEEPKQEIVPVTLDSEIVTVLEHSGLDQTQAAAVLEGFKNFFEEVREYEKEAKAIIITDATQVTEMKKARDIRLKLKNIRVNAEKVRKDRKEFFLRGGKAIDGMANVLKALIVPLEDHLDKQENYAERMEEERKERVNQERIEKLRPYVQDITLYNLKDMPDNAFDILLKGSIKAYEDQKAAEEQAEKDRIAKEEAEKAEQERIKEENKKLKEEAEEREKAHAEEKRKADEEKAEADRIAAEEKKKREQAEADKAKAEADLKKKQEEEERQKKEKEEADRKAEEEKAKLERARKYRAFRAEHGWTEETKGDFYEQADSEKVVLYKKVGVFNLK